MVPLAAYLHASTQVIVERMPNETRLAEMQTITIDLSD